MGSAVTRVLVDVEVDELKARPDSTVKSFRAHGEFKIDGRLVAMGRGDAILVDPAAYAKMRGGRQAARTDASSFRVDPDKLGRLFAEDVVLGAREPDGRWPLIVDTGNPILFDHPLDHIPGMLLMEAARQSVFALNRGRRIVEIDATFGRITEFDQPAFIEATRECCVRIIQADEVVTSLIVRLSS